MNIFLYLCKKFLYYFVSIHIEIKSVKNIFLNFHSKEDAYTIFRDAAALNMTEAGHVWIVTEQALNANNTPDGVLGLQLVFANSEKEHIRVSEWKMSCTYTHMQRRIMR